MGGCNYWRFMAYLIEGSPEEATMKLSARNQLKGVVRKIVPGAVNSEVVIEVGPGIHLIAVITKESVKEMGLDVGSPAYAVIKASSVMVAVDH